MNTTTITLRVVWRPIAGGDIYVQDWQSSTRGRALGRWSRFWGLRQRDCAEFSATATATTARILLARPTVTNTL